MTLRSVPFLMTNRVAVSERFSAVSTDLPHEGYLVYIYISKD